ncbi:MAG: hypothetical protein RIR10_475 [Planctomycetota bacterium]|jgi:hypothetical protein
MVFGTHGAAIAAGVLSLSSTALASIVNGGFESPNQGYVLFSSGQTVGNWTCVGSNVEYVHAVPTANLPGLEFSAYEGNYWIDLGGVGGPSGIYQDLVGLTAGQWYRVSFAQAGNVWGPNVQFTVQVSWNGSQAGSFTSVHGGNNGANMNWQERFVDVLATEGTNRLQFFSPVVVSARGGAVDAVSIAPIPSPGVCALLSMFGLAARRRR